MESSGAETSSGSEYQVFLNFRGDTREKFTDHLYYGLKDAGIRVFRDEEGLDFGEDINKALPKAIDNSRIYIPIFSRNYASSPWCLRELVQIVENASKSNGHKEILPIFLDVEPDDVKLKTTLYEEDMRQLNSKRKDKLNTEPVKSWREALKKVGPMKGLEVKTFNGEAKLIKLVVEKVVKKLKMKQKSVTEHLIGINDQVVAVKDLLDVGSEGVRLIQIHGMGGIGKTTLAKVVFNQLSTHFGNYCYFLEDVREKSSRTDGLVELQKKLLSNIGSDTGARNIDATDYGMTRIEDTLSMKKVFIVLDDVDKSEQVEKLVGKGALCSGSRVVITTRNKDVLGNSKPTYGIKKYEMEVMSSDDALQLFRRHAFAKDSPLDDCYDISKEIVHATGRLPLTIEVIGSMLRGKKDKKLWKETLDQLHKAPPADVLKKLRISYDALTHEQQQIFLDIACFFIGKEKTNAICMWDSCGYFPYSGIAVLENMSLIKIRGDNWFLMHDQLRDLGRGIVRNENLMNPEERSRLWIKEEVLNAIKTKKMKNVEAMALDLYPQEESIKSEDIGRFEKLRFLRLDGGTFVGDLMDCFPKLRWIDCYAAFPNMCLKNVVVLELSETGIDHRKLQSLIKEARKLKVLSLACCSGITRIPDLSGCSTLEKLVLKWCYEIQELPTLPTSLTHLEMRNTPLRVVPDLSNLTNLVELNLTVVSKIDERDGRMHTGDSRWIGNLKNLSKLILFGSQIQEIKLDGLQLPNLKVLSLHECEWLVKFMLSSMRNLKEVSVHQCPKLDEIRIAGVLESLEELSINLCDSFGRLVYDDIQWESSYESSLILASGVFNKLRKLWLHRCNEILSIQFVDTLEELSIISCDRLRSLDLSNLKSLKSLEMTGNRELQPVKGHDQVVEFLSESRLPCPQSLESLVDVLTTQLPDDCHLFIYNCSKLRGVDDLFVRSVGDCSVEKGCSLLLSIDRKITKVGPRKVVELPALLKAKMNATGESSNLARGV